ncbi:cardiolipin synthase [uncultured Alistipes sp.]|uniref:cardiolipin synthase n=2 Tax=uncultured Alistipes sp. TaxID=538949 RepID=UPI0025E8BFD2|nr:cardiolipin synthase [uncultured Alistipes sp.]
MARSMPLARDMYIVLLIHLLWTLGTVPVVTRQQRVPASAAAWLALILLLPVAGTLLYILAGYRCHAPAAVHGACRGDHLEQIVARGCGTRPTQHNRVRLLHNGNNAFSALIASLQRATRSIHMEYYIIRDDRIGRTIAEILIRKARAGLEVRVIYDAVGSWRLNRTMLRRMHAAGIETAAYEPIRFPWFTTHVTHRNHRKIVVTDGKVAYLGGINIAKYYLDGDYMGKWRDEHLRVEGDAVADLQRLFIADWAHARGECLDSRRYIAPHAIRRRLPIQLAWAEEGPSRLTIAEAFAAAIVRASDTVRISSPYFMPPAMLLDALRLAARGGVRVQVMIPTCSDSPFTDLISDSYVGDLLDAGVELYRYDNGFLHAKLLIVDDHTASVGTANIDYRSLLDNLEVTAFIRDREVVRALSATFDNDLASCRRVVPEAWKPAAWRRTLGDALRLVSPLM